MRYVWRILVQLRMQPLAPCPPPARIGMGGVRTIMRQVFRTCCPALVQPFVPLHTLVGCECRPRELMLTVRVDVTSQEPTGQQRMLGKYEK